MKNGKVSESVLVRSILKRIKYKRKEILCGAGIGTDCAILSFSKDEKLVLSTNPVSAPMEDITVYSIHKAVNNIAVPGRNHLALCCPVCCRKNAKKNNCK